MVTLDQSKVSPGETQNDIDSHRESTLHAQMSSKEISAQIPTILKTLRTNRTTHRCDRMTNESVFRGSRHHHISLNIGNAGEIYDEKQPKESFFRSA